jgi:hypothetical protein
MEYCEVENENDPKTKILKLIDWIEVCSNDSGYVLDRDCLPEDCWELCKLVKNYLDAKK